MISAIIPAFNESESIQDVLNELIAKLKIVCGDNFEVIVVDDCSTDNTREIVSKFDSSAVSFVENIINMGYGFSLKKGINAAKNDTILILDGDGTYPLDNLGELLREYQRGFDLVIADRGSSFSEDSWLKSVFRTFLRRIVEFTSGTPIPDVNSGLRIFSKNAVSPYLHLMSDQFSFTTSMTLLYVLDRKLILFSLNGYRKRAGKSKVKLRRDIFRTLQIILELIALKNPLKLHMLIILFSALVWFIVITATWAITGILAQWALSGFLLTLFVQISITAHALQAKVHNRTS